MNETASSDAREAVVVVHAHPDDESLTMGGTLARLASGAGRVVLVTATRGELGEVIPPELAALEGSAELAPFRVDELAAAMRALGVADHRFLGAADARTDGSEPRIYRDSGMQWGTDPRTGSRRPEPLEPLAADSLCAAPLEEAVADLIAVLDDVGADRVISYDAGGGYGHPDHVRAAEIAETAAAVLGLPFVEIVPEGFPARDDDVVVALTEQEFERKRAALLAHRTQLVVEGDTVRLSSGEPFPIARAERFRPVGAVAAEKELPSRLARIGSGLLSVGVGALIGVITTVAHQSTVTLGGVVLPLGLIVSVLAVLGVLLGMRLVMADRFVAFCTAMGLLGAIGLFSIRSPGGSVLVPANTAGVVWTFAPALIALIVIAWPRIRRVPGAGLLPAGAVR